MVTSLLLQNFRSYTDGQFEFSSGVTIIVGPNGSGKTSLLEALLFACQGKSYKSSDEEVIKKEADWARIDITIENDHSRSVKLQTQPNGEKVNKSFIIDGTAKQRFMLGYALPAVLFEPQHMNILTGDPSGRREFLDTVLGAVEIGYTANLKNYKRALAQRNALLKSPRPPRPDELFVWDLRLSELGGVIHAARKHIIELFLESMQQTYASLSGKQDAVSISYAADGTTGDYTEFMLKKLTENAQKDIQRGFTSTGPHRDDFVLYIHGLDAKASASRGETRSLLLALKLLEIKQLEKVVGKKPIILLDDVFSELDGARRQALAGALSDYQAFITTTDADLVVEHFTDKAHIIALS